MEIGRWSLKKISSLSSGYRDLAKFLAEVLDGERDLIGGGAPGAVSFEVRGDFERVLEDASPLPLQGEKQRLAVFSLLAPYFEAGFLLRTNSEDSSQVALESMFIFGRVYQAGAMQKPLLSLCFPDFKSGHVYRGRSEAVMRAFHLEALDRLKDAAAFALSPRAGTAIVLICNRPRLWQLSALEEVVRVVSTLRDQE